MVVELVTAGLGFVSLRWVSAVGEAERGGRLLLAYGYLIYVAP